MLNLTASVDEKTRLCVSVYVVVSGCRLSVSVSFSPNFSVTFSDSTGVCLGLSVLLSLAFNLPLLANFFVVKNDDYF